MNPFKRLSPLSNQLLEDTSYFPKGDKIFEAFSFPVEDLKLVILGRWPLRDSQEASGIAYTQRISSYNQNLEKHLYEVISIYDKENLHSNTINIKSWADKGILMLNTSLTTQTGREEIHKKYWYNFMGSLIKRLSAEKPTIWFVFGEDLYDYSKFIFNKVTASNYNDDTIRSIPKLNDVNYVFYDKNPLIQLNKVNKNFKNGFHFKHSNEILLRLGESLIKW